MVKKDNKFIYGNEIGTILGVNRNQNVKSQTANEKNEEIYWINTLKELLSKEFTIRSGKKVRKELKTIIDEEYDFMRCNIDRRIVGENSILLCSVYSGDNSNFEINENTLFECQHNMRVAKADKCYVAYLINDKKFIFYEILRDEEMISRIIEEVKSLDYNHMLV